MLYSDSAGCFLIGCLCNQPHLIRSGKYPLTREDFKPNLLHEHLYAVISNLAYKGLEEITEIEIDQFIQPYETTKDIIYDKDGLEFIQTVKQQALSGNIDLYYPVIRKFSLLRSARDKGMDITEIYDENKDKESQLANFNKYSIVDLINYFDNRVIELKKEYNANTVRKEMWLGDNFVKVLTTLKESPAMGAGLCSPYETAIFRGWQRGHLLMRSAPSSGGKTTRAIGDLCNVSIPYLWNSEQQAFVKNQNYQGKGFYIHTESDQEYEIQPKFMSYICDIPYHVILDGSFTPQEEKRMIEAVEMMEHSIMLIDMPNFTIPLLRDTIKEMAITEHCCYGVFDYIQDNGIAGKTYKNETGTALRQDMVLLAIATDLKACAEDFNVGILTMSQLNGNEKINSIIDEACLSGSKAMKNKLDGGMICLSPTSGELEQTATLAVKRGKFGESPRPNQVTHIYKGRYNKYSPNLKLFQHLDFATGRVYDMYVTDANNAPVHVDKVYVKKDSEETL